MANVRRLAPFSDLSLIDNFAKTYSINPDEVFNKVPFDTIIQLAWMWKEQHEFQERKADIERMMTESKAK